MANSTVSAPAPLNTPSDKKEKEEMDHLLNSKSNSNSIMIKKRRWN